jgi:tRNA-dihydrouridine synthase B
MQIQNPSVSEEMHLQLGPFQGITDVYFRQVYMKHFEGIDKLFTPFFSGIHKENSKNLRNDEIKPALNNLSITVPQLLSNDAEEIIRFSSQCGALGYNEINLNMGCPYPLVAKKKRGSGLLPYPNMVQSMLEKLEGRLSTKFSIKCRLGYHSPDEIDELIPLFNNFDLSELIIHARIGKQLYKGVPDFDRFKAVISQINAPLVYNGDVFSLHNLDEYQAKFEFISSWMLGRGLLADPFLPSDLKRIEIVEKNETRKDKVRLFMNELYQLRREMSKDNLSVLGRMKELWSYLRFSFDEPQTVWRLVRKVKNFAEYESATDEVFNQLHWLGTGYARKNESQLIEDQQD